MATKKKNEGVEKTVDPAKEAERAEKAAAAKAAGEKKQRAKKEAAAATEAAATAEPKAPKGPMMTPNMLTHYRKVVAPNLMKDFGYPNPMLVPKLQKIVVNTSIKEAISNVKLIETAAEELTLITGQKAIIRRAKKSIANFKLREGMPIGAKVTLRGPTMWFFLERLISIAIPRIRDFRGISPTAFDGRGNYSLGLAEQLIFPEIDYDKIQRVSGMNITFVTSAPTDAEALALLKHLGMPFRDN